ncbi:MAG: HU family DNA-binding protein [Methylobacter sp.]
MTKQELLTKLAEETHLTKKQVEEVLKSLASTIKAEVVATGEFTLQDIAKFKTSVRAAAERRNPRTGEMFQSPEKNVIKVIAAKVLRDAVN